MVPYNIALTLFTHDNRELARELCVSADLVADWRSGKIAPPPLVLRYLELKASTARPDLWRGFVFDGNRLVFPFGGSLAYEELSRLPEYRRAHHVCCLQADHIERLLVERDFYRQNCHRQARFGMLLNSIFGAGYDRRDDFDDSD